MKREIIDLSGKPYEFPLHILDEIAEERQRRIDKAMRYGMDSYAHESDDKQNCNDWVSRITVFLGRAVSTGNGNWPGKRHRFRAHMLTVAVLAIAAIEAFDRNGGITPCEMEKR